MYPEIEEVELFHDVTNDANRKRKFSRFGYNFGRTHGFWTYIRGYKIALETLVKRYDEEDYSNNALLDEIVYPIIFTSRHVVELYLKFFLIKYNKNKYGNISSNLSKHDLEALFDELEPSLNALCKKMEIPYNSKVVRSYIKQLNDHDVSSAVFRYPVDKNYESNFQKSTAIDINDFFEKMNTLYLYLDGLDAQLDSAILDKTYDKKQGNYLFLKCSEVTKEIDELLEVLEEEHSYEEDEEGFCRLCSIIEKIGDEKMKYINLLLFSGGDLLEGIVKLPPRNPQDRKDAFCQLLISNYSYDFICNRTDTNLGINPDYKLLETSPACLISWLKESVDVLRQIKEETSNDFSTES